MLELALTLVERSDIGTGEADIYFNYDKIQFEAGDAEDGVGGLGGMSARAGFSAGTGVPRTFDELPGSGVSSAPAPS